MRASITLYRAQRRRLERQVHKSSDALLVRRILAVLYLADGQSVSAVARRLAAARSSVGRWQGGVGNTAHEPDMPPPPTIHHTAYFFTHHRRRYLMYDRQSDADNHADQMNPNNDAYWESRGYDERPDDWEEQAAAAVDDDHEMSQAELDNHANQMNPNNDAC